MKNLIQETIAKIEKQHLVPEAKWKHWLKKYGIWFLFATGVILTAVSLMVAFDNANNLDWDLYCFGQQNRLVYIFSILPYFWIILMAIFLATTFLEIRKTETGYRYSWLRMILITFGGIVIFGVLVSIFGIGGRLNSKLTKDFPFYGQHMVVTKESQWMQPAKGFLAGTIISIAQNKLEIKDLNNKSWNISLDEKTLIKPSANISQEKMIKLIGERIDENNFKAQEIRPWQGKGMGNGKMTGGDCNREGLMTGN